MIRDLEDIRIDLTRYATKMFGQDADDIVSNAILKAMVSTGPKEPKAFRNWMYVIVNNEGVTYKRKCTPRAKWFGGTVSIDAMEQEVQASIITVKSEDNRVVDAVLIELAMRQLSKRDREMLHARYIDGLSHAELSQRFYLGTRSNTRTCLHRVRVRFKKALDRIC